MHHPRLRIFLHSFLAGASAVAGASAAGVDFHEHVGMQLYSVRTTMATDPVAALDLVKGYGVVEVETAGTGNRTPEDFSALLQARGLHAIGAHIGYDRLVKDFAGAVHDAKALGVKYVICPVLPASLQPFTRAVAEATAARFEKWGELLAREGLQFALHTHGPEFRPFGDGSGENGFDVLVKGTKPEHVVFEMDVFWVVHAGVDPVALLEKYSTRWQLMHVKDMRAGAPTGLFTSKAPPADCVPVGAGFIDWPRILAAGQRAGVGYYLLEDETPDPARSIPLSLRYLRELKL